MSALLLAALLAVPASAQVEAPSGIHVGVSSAAVTGLACERRPFVWENTKTVARRYKVVGGQMITEGLDPRPIVMGVFASVLMAPVMVAAVPADLLSGPFRKTCSFTLRLEGTLDEWAGQKRRDTDYVIEAASLLEPEVENVSKAKWDLFRATGTSDAAGRFAVAIPARIGRTKELGLRWRVNEQPAGQMLLQKNGRSFVLSEPDPGFGVGAAEMQPILIEPDAK
ncbi:MAG: hypothetical protein FD126_3587 [Elusimicrobia bacterium]|nr:MAG: hypothetical protein FD126_3587 [Elusimicrobiota bacterium]